MTVASPPARHIEEVPALLVQLLHDCGKLPTPPSPVDRSVLGFRMPTLRDLNDYTWLCQWQGERVNERGFCNVAGIAAYRDTFDFHSASEVRECVSLIGSPRACFALVECMMGDARLCGRRFVGSFDADNVLLKRALERLGMRQTRITMEAA